MEEDAQRKKRIAFTKEDDVEMLTLVVSENPFINHNSWKTIANELTNKRSKCFTKKNVRDRVNHLIVLFREKKIMQREGSGRGYYNEIHRLLRIASDLKREANDNQHLKKINKLRMIKAEAEQENVAVTYISDHQYTINEKKQVEGNDEDEEEPSPMFPLSDIMECTMDPLLIHPNIDEEIQAVQHTASNPATAPQLSTSKTTEDFPPTSSNEQGTPITSHDVSKKTVLQIVWTKLKEEQAYKTELLAVERLKAENEKLKLQVEDRKNSYKHETECKKIKLEETRMNLLKEHFDRTSTIQEKMLAFLESLIKKGQ